MLLQRYAFYSTQTNNSERKKRRLVPKALPGSSKGTSRLARTEQRGRPHGADGPGAGSRRGRKCLRMNRLFVGVRFSSVRSCTYIYKYISVHAQTDKNLYASQRAKPSQEGQARCEVGQKKEAVTCTTSLNISQLQEQNRTACLLPLHPIIEIVPFS